MQLRYPSELSKRLTNQLDSAYFIASQDPLLLMEACDDILLAARSKGYLEREIHTVEPNFNWQQLLESGSALSLFASLRILDIRIPNGKPGKEGTEVLEQLLEQSGSDTILLVRTPTWESSIRNLKWVKLFQKNATSLVIWPLDEHKFPDWVAQRANKLGLDLDATAIQHLVHKTEGNLLACDQELKKLLLLKGQTSIYSREVEQLVADSARFDVFSLLETALKGDAKRCLNILAHLRGEGSSAVPIHYVLMQRLQLLAALAAAQGHSEQQNALFKQHRVWKTQQAGLQRLAHQRNPGYWYKLVQRGIDVERVLKGRSPGDGWFELERLLLSLTRTPVPSRPQL